MRVANTKRNIRKMQSLLRYKHFLTHTNSLMMGAPKTSLWRTTKWRICRNGINTIFYIRLFRIINVIGAMPCHSHEKWIMNEWLHQNKNIWANRLKWRWKFVLSPKTRAFSILEMKRNPFHAENSEHFHVNSLLVVIRKVEIVHCCEFLNFFSILAEEITFLPSLSPELPKMRFFAFVANLNAWNYLWCRIRQLRNNEQWWRRCCSWVIKIFSSKKRKISRKSNYKQNGSRPNFHSFWEKWICVKKICNYTL